MHDKSEGLVLTGTTGESPNLSLKDREIIYSTAIDSVSDKAKIIAGTGTYSTSESIEITKMADSVARERYLPDGLDEFRELAFLDDVQLAIDDLRLEAA